MGIAAGRLWIRAVSQHVSFALFFFSGAASRLRGVKPHADERSEKVRWLSAGSVSKSQVSCSNSVKRFSSGFAGVVQAAFGIG